MLIFHDEDQYETVHTHSTCAYHMAHPGKMFAGCTCSFGISSRPRDPDEVMRIKVERIRRQEDEILAQADAIRWRRSQAR